MNIAVIEFGQGNRQFLNMKFSNLKRSLSNLHNIESTSLHLPGNNIERMIGSPFVERERERGREGERETHTTQLRLVPLI